MNIHIKNFYGALSLPNDPCDPLLNTLRLVLKISWKIQNQQNHFLHKFVLYHQTVQK